MLRPHRREQHPYTAALLASVPSAEAIREKSALQAIEGEVPDTIQRAARLPVLRPLQPCHRRGAHRCADAEPPLAEVAPGHKLRCWLPRPHERGALLEVTDLSKHFRSRRGLASALTGQGRMIPAVDGVSFYLKENETVGLVGESGCGKTTIGRTVLRLTEPSGGRILFGGRDITHLDRAALRPLRREMQMIFQDLDAGLNPKMRVRAILREALTVYERPSDAEIERRIRELLEQVNLKESKLANFPAELSGGEKRRVGIARVLAVRPRLIVADEPTSALDVSIQAQVVNLLRDLQKQPAASRISSSRTTCRWSSSSATRWR